jgi:DNA invertase Pin-like site-specific DNA recombinase
MCRAVGYVRVSTESQMKNGEGLKIQRQEIERYCTDKNIELVKVFSDEAVSGANEDRNGINELLTYVAENKIDRVIIHKIDRLSRDTMYGLFIRKELKKVDVELLSINEESLSGNDPVSELMNTIILAFATFEKSQISNRMLLGRREKALNKKQKSSGNCPFGYCYRYDNLGKNPIVVLDESAAKVVKEMFSLYSQGKSLQKIADYLNESGVKTSRGNDWSKQAVKVVLSNEFYTGLLKFDDIEEIGNHPIIINKITFGRVQVALQRNRKRV